MSKRIRILVLTDSLGSPREGIEPNETWTEMLLERYSMDCLVYIKCIPGLSIRDVNTYYIGFLKPDILILQVGVVDACRRALKKTEIKLLSFFPHLSRKIHSFFKRHHYTATRLRDIHSVDENEFAKIIETIEHTGECEKLYIEIAPPGEYLVNMTYHVEQDVKRYNDILDKHGHVLKIYEEIYEQYLLEDGHHLNKAGHKHVFGTVSRRIDLYLASKV